MGEGGCNMVGGAQAWATPRGSKVNKIEQVPYGYIVVPPHEQKDMTENITFPQTKYETCIIP